MKIINLNYRAAQLKSVIENIKPDIIHSMDIQGGGYLTDKAKKICSGKFPKWLVTNWGSDIYYFQKFPEHEKQIRSVLKNADFYSSECERDVLLAKQYGFRGKTMPVFPNAGGYNLEEAWSLRKLGRTSERRQIMLKGYQGWAGRALIGLEALVRCADVLHDYEIVIYSVVPSDSGVEQAAKLLTDKTGILTRILPLGTTHKEILKYHGMSRISIGLSISDGISTSFLEALVMGSFPIQSNTACANEWIECGKTGFIVPPEDPEKIEEKIRIALKNDNLVDRAAVENWETAKQKLDWNNLKEKTINIYTMIANQEK